MGKFIIIGIAGYLVIGLIFMRYAYTIAKKKAKDKAEGIGCVLLAVLFLWPLVPIAAFVMGGGMAEERKREEAIAKLEKEKQDHLETIEKWAEISSSDPDSTMIYRSVYDYNMPRVKELQRQIEDLKQGNNNGH